MSDLYLYPNRTLCAVLEDMRKMHETRNYSALLACIEEVQYLANKMEASLEDKRDLKRVREKLSETKKKFEELDKKLKAQQKRRKTKNE